MSQVISIRFPATLSAGQISGFLSEWEHFGTWKAHAERSYDLQPQAGESLLLNCLETELEFTGYPEDAVYEFIEAYAGRHNGELLYEGEPVANAQAVLEAGRPGAIAKAGRGIAGFFIVVFTILALPVVLLVAFVRLIYFMGGALLAERGKARK